MVAAVVLLACNLMVFGLGCWVGWMWGRRAGYKAALERVPEATRAGFEAGVGAVELAYRRQRGFKFGEEPSRN